MTSTSTVKHLSSSSTNEYLSDLISQSTNHVSSSTIDDMRKMTCSSAARTSYTNLTVLDVYDEAALIGKDFERIIETYGTETIRDLIPKVIRILELLESQAAKNEQTMEEFLEMKTRIERLEMEKNETRELREKYERDVESIEDQWRKEADNLMTVVSNLQDENRRLREQLSRQNHSELPSPTETVSITREELQYIKNLTDENVKYKRLIKSKDKELTQKSLDVEAIQSQLERICKLNCTLRQKNTFSTNQTQRLIREKLDLEVQLKEKENIIHQMKDRVTDDLISPTSPTSPTLELDVNEAKRPRFTLEELRQVLWERNDLKTKLLEVEEELRLFREQEDDTAPVEGPIPLEPEEKLYGSKRDDSKVRQFAKICLYFPPIACFAVASYCLRSLFPISRKPSIVESNTSLTSSTSSTMPITPTTSSPSNAMVSRSYSTYSSPSNRDKYRDTPKSNFPLLSPPASE